VCVCVCVLLSLLFVFFKNLFNDPVPVTHDIYRFSFSPSRGTWGFYSEERSSILYNINKNIYFYIHLRLCCLSYVYGSFTIVLKTHRQSKQNTQTQAYALSHIQRERWTDRQRVVFFFFSFFFVFDVLLF